MKGYKWLLLLALAGLLAGGLVIALAGRPVQAQDPPLPGSALGVQMRFTHFRLDWYVIGSGGGEISSAHFRMRSTIGQPAVGWKSSTHFQEHTGYWQPFIRRIFLPLVLRSYSS